MNTSYAKTDTLLGEVFAPMDLARSIGLVLTFSVLTGLAAQVAIPLPWTPVPITAQTLVVLMTGILLGSRLGALAMIAYLIEGASGLPFFSAGRSGVFHLLFTPSTGYLFAFPVAAFVVGLLAERKWDRRVLLAALAMTLGSAIILLGGWLGLLRFMSPWPAFLSGVAPFIPGDIIKIALAAVALPSGWAILRRIGHTNRES
jgi:biotin transport system substrate-specific component